MDNVELALTRMFLSTDAGIVSDACAIKCLKLIPTRKVSTAATDGVVLLYNPEFVSTLTIAQTIGLLVHEVCHVRFEHNQRFEESGWLDHDRANRAMDMEINPIVAKAGYSLPDDGCWPHDIGEWEGKSWEEYYALLMSKPQAPSTPSPAEAGDGAPKPAEGKENGQTGPSPPEAETGSSEPAEGPEGDDSGEPGESTGAPESEGGSPPEGSGESAPEAVQPGAHAAGSLVQAFAPELLGEAPDPEALARQVQEQLQDASADSKLEPPEPAQPHQAGRGSGQQVLNAGELIIASDCRWQDVVIEMVGQRASGESVCDWSKPHRRSISSGVYRPSRRRVNGYKLALVVDVSGSCVHFFSAWQALAREMVEAIPEITALEILYHDDFITKRDDWHRRDGNEIEIACNGGGGTSHREVLAEVEKLDVDGCVLFTDSESYWPESCSVDCVTVQPPGSTERTPFGKNVRITAW